MGRMACMHKANPFYELNVLSRPVSQLCEAWHAVNVPLVKWRTSTVETHVLTVIYNLIHIHLIN